MRSTERDDSRCIAHAGPWTALAFVALLLAGGPAFAGDVCGDGLIEGDETCDPPGQPAGQPTQCRDDCTFCGDGIVDMMMIKGQAAGEQCDDGNNDDGDGCSATCSIEEPAVCGDGVVEGDETCDPPGEPADQPNECREDCTFCGDGNVDMGSVKDDADGEECDDGNNDGGDGCRANCTVEICGDGIVDPGEECDDGDANDDDGDCRTDCTLNTLLVVLESFTATVTPDGVRIGWVTALEVDNVGFRLLRAHLDGQGREKALHEVPLHEGLLPAAGSELEGATYDFLDNTRLAPGRYRYLLEDVDLFGRKTRHEPVVVVIRPARRVAPSIRVERAEPR